MGAGYDTLIRDSPVRRKRLDRQRRGWHDATVTAILGYPCVGCADAYSLARWWADILDYIDDPDDPAAPGRAECMIMSPDRRHGLLFREVTGARPGEHRLPFCLRPPAGSADEELDRLLARGATRVADERDPDGAGWVVLADPQGHEFRLRCRPAGVPVAGAPTRPARPSYPLRTARLLLRPLTTADTAALLAYRGRADVCRYVPSEPMDPEAIAGRLAGSWSNHTITGEGQSLTLGVELAGTGELVGDVVLFWHSSLHGTGEAGWVLNPDFGGHGYATEAARELLRLGFDELGLRRITARIEERNTASVRLAQRLGMRLEARLVENEIFKGEISTELDFAMLAAEWPAHRGAGDPAPTGCRP
jgi:RimJ/RimL family protein N-acetyltransferase